MAFDRRQLLSLLGATAMIVALGGHPAEAANPFKVIKNFLIPKGLTADSAQVSLAPRPNGGFAALYETDSGETYTPSFARNFKADGSLDGAPVALARTTYAGNNIGTMIVNADGSANAFYFGWYKDNFSDLWWMQRISATGKPVGDAVRLGTGSSGDFHLAAKLKNGSILSAWRGYSGTQGRVVSTSGKILAENNGDLCNGTLEGIAATPNGGAVAAYYGPDLKASFQRLTGSAKRTGTPISVPSLYSFGGMAVASHPKGFVGVWKNSDGNGDPIMQGAVYSSTGSKVATLAPVALRPSGSEDRYRDFFATMLALGDGRTIVAYDSVRRPDPNASKRFYEIIAVLYAANGKMLGKQTLYSQVATTELWDYLTRPRSLIRLNNGRFLLGYDGGYEYGIEQARGIMFQFN